MDFSVYLINILVLGIVFYWYQKKVKHFDHNSLLISSWLLAAICGYLYSSLDEVYIGKGKIELVAVLFMITCIVVAIFPLTKLKTLSDNNYVYKNNSIILILTYFVAIIGVEPFLEPVIHIATSNVISDMGDYHDNRVFMGLTQISHFTKLGVILHRWSGYYNIVAGVLFFNYFNKNNKKINKLLLVCLLCSFSEPTITSFAFGSRWAAFQFIFLFAFLFLVFSPSLNTKIKKKITLYASISGVLIIAGFMLISITRFGDNADETFLESIYRYAGEGFNNTYTDMWYINNHTWGAHIFRNVVGINAIQLSVITGIRMHVYYTFVGDLICDYTKEGAAIIILFFSTLLYKFTSKKYLKVEDMLLITLYAYTILTGYTYIPFMNTAPCILGTFVTYFIIKIFSIKPQYS